MNTIEQAREVRDYFAAKAMHGRLASYLREMEAKHVVNGALVIADLSYAIADARLKERAK